MSPRQREAAIVWAFRLLLNREPPDAATVAGLAPGMASLADVQDWAHATPEYQRRLHDVGRVREQPRDAVDLQDGIVWANRLYLSREPSEREIARQARRLGTIDEIRLAVLLSREFEESQGLGRLDLRDAAILNRFAPFCGEPAPEGFFHDILGTRTRVSYLPAGHAGKSGTVEGAPHAAGAAVHGASEWVATLRSVIEARDGIVAVELGAGWAPWLVAVAFAAARVGISDVSLIGVEGSASHLAFARQHFRDNGLDPDAHRLLHAVAGATDGVARFPVLDDPAENYGGQAIFGDGAGAPAGGSAWEEVASLSLRTLLREVDVVDILHVDIQGAELDVLRAGFDTLAGKVRRIVVGTHGRRIEAELMDLFAGAGWRLESEKGCVVRQEADGTIALLVDGEQVWRNPRPPSRRRGLARVLPASWRRAGGR